MNTQQDKLIIAGREFNSRLMVGTGKYADFQQMVKAIEISGAEIITVAVRRVNISDRNQESLLDHIDLKKYTLLPNTAGCYTADDAVRTCRLAREAGLSDFVKLEVLGDEKTLFPDNEELLKAAKILVAEGFTVLPYCSDDVTVCRKLEDIGCAAVMPLGAPIGSGLGIRILRPWTWPRACARARPRSRPKESSSKWLPPRTSWPRVGSSATCVAASSS